MPAGEAVGSVAGTSIQPLGVSSKISVDCSIKRHQEESVADCVSSTFGENLDWSFGWNACRNALSSSVHMSATRSACAAHHGVHPDGFIPLLSRCLQSSVTVKRTKQRPVKQIFCNKSQKSTSLHKLSLSHTTACADNGQVLAFAEVWLVCMCVRAHVSRATPLWCHDKELPPSVD